MVFITAKQGIHKIFVSKIQPFSVNTSVFPVYLSQNYIFLHPLVEISYKILAQIMSLGIS